MILFCCFSIAGIASSNANYVIKINNTDNYYLWLRAKASAQQSSSIYVKIDNLNIDSLIFTESGQYQWKRVDNTYLLTQGSHKIVLTSDIFGTYIDKILVTSQAEYTPSGVGEAAVNPSSIVNVWKAIDLGGKGGIPIMGDINNNGQIDFVVTGDEDISVYDNNGTLLWQSAISGIKLDYVYSTMYCRPYDIDGDGATEVVGTICFNDKLYLAAMDGATGIIETAIELPALSGSWEYDCIQIANLQGNANSQDVILKTTPDYNPFRIYAYYYVNGNFQLGWEFYLNETRGVCHQPRVFDIDEDGFDEVMLGYWTLEETGAIKWEKPYGYFDDHNHIDSIRPGDIIPTNPGIEIAYSSGNVILDSDGNLLWRKSEFQSSDGQSVALAEMRPEHPGLEVLFAYQEPNNDERLFTSDGMLLWTWDGAPHYAASYETYPIQWIGDEGKEYVRQEWGRDRSPSIYDEYNNFVVKITPEYKYGEIGYRPCDVTGDYREELVCFNKDFIVIYENTALNSGSFSSPWNDPIYVENHYNWTYY